MLCFGTMGKRFFKVLTCLRTLRFTATTVLPAGMRKWLMAGLKGIRVFVIDSICSKKSILVLQLQFSHAWHPQFGVSDSQRWLNYKSSWNSGGGVTLFKSVRPVLQACLKHLWIAWTISVWFHVHPFKSGFEMAFHIVCFVCTTFYAFHISPGLFLQSSECILHLGLWWYSQSSPESSAIITGGSWSA